MHDMQATDLGAGGNSLPSHWDPILGLILSLWLPRPSVGEVEGGSGVPEGWGCCQAPRRLSAASAPREDADPGLHVPPGGACAHHRRRPQRPVALHPRRPEQP